MRRESEKDVSCSGGYPPRSKIFWGGETMAKKISATGANKAEARDNLNLALMRSAGSVKPLGGIKYDKNSDGTITAWVKIIESR